MRFTRNDAPYTVALALIVSALTVIVACGIFTAYRVSIQTNAQDTQYRLACVYSGGQMHGLDCIR